MASVMVLIRLGVDTLAEATALTGLGSRAPGLSALKGQQGNKNRTGTETARVKWDLGSSACLLYTAKEKGGVIAYS